MHFQLQPQLSYFYSEILGSFLKEPAMARIPEAEIERLKEAVPVERLVEASGIELSLPTMNTRDEQFFKELGARIAQARKDHRLTPQTLAEQLGAAQQTLAHYEVGRARMPASMLPTVAWLLTLSLDELMGPRAARCPRRSWQVRQRQARPGFEQQIQAVAQLPKTKLQFVSQMLDTVLAQVSR